MAGNWAQYILARDSDAHETTTTITCGKGPDAYEVTITGQYLNSAEPTGLKKTLADFAIMKKTGEDLVAAILAAGWVSKIERKRHGQLTDGPNSEPGRETFIGNRSQDIEHFKNGKLHDAANGDAAHQILRYTDLLWELRYTDGINCDSADGQAAELMFRAQTQEATVRSRKKDDSGPRRELNPEEVVAYIAKYIDRRPGKAPASATSRPGPASRPRPM